MITLGAFFAFLASLTFGLTDATARRGVLSGSAFDAMLVSMPIGAVLFLIASLITGQLFRLDEFSTRAVLYLIGAGIIHFIWGRYWNFKAIQALGSNLAAPMTQLSFLISLSLALIVLNESLNTGRIIGIILIIAGPLVVLRESMQNHSKLDFKPRLVEGYLAGFFNALGFGASPILIRLALRDAPLAVVGGLVSYTAALAVLVLLLLIQGRLVSSLTNMDAQALRWFSYAGLSVAVSQLLRFVALGLAPVIIVTPLVRLSIIFRIIFSTLLNRKYEVLGFLLITGIAVSFIGGLILVFSNGS